MIRYNFRIGCTSHTIQKLWCIQVSPPAPIVVIALIFTFFLTAAMERYLSAELPSASNNIILTPKSLNPKANELKTIEEFKLYRKQYIRCKALTKTPKNIK